MGPLNHAEKGVIMDKLKMNLDELRGLKSPGGYYCSLGQRPLLDNIFWTDGAVDSIAGPFATEAQLN